MSYILVTTESIVQMLVKIINFLTVEIKDASQWDSLIDKVTFLSSFLLEG